MSSLINDTIREILMEEQQVCIPGIGTLRLDPQPAVVSPIEGRVSPPSDRATFNSNLVLDDGRILRSLQDIPLLSDQEAKLLLDQYLSGIRESLDAGRSVTLEGIGRLFKHFDGEIRFTAGGENFSKNSYGLPPVELKPIARSEKQRRTAADPMLAGAAATTSASKVKPIRAEKPKSKWQQITQHPDLKQILWYIAAFLATAAILVLGYLLFVTVMSEIGDDPVAREEEAPLVLEEPPRRTTTPPVDADRVTPGDPPRLDDPRPALETDPAPTSSPAPATAPPTRVEEAPQAQRPTTDYTPNEPTAANPPVQSGSPYNTAFIATGLYGNAANVTKNRNRITKAGYEAFDRREGRFTRVGVRVRYTNRGDLLETLHAVQKIYDDAFVMEINGEKVKID